MTPGPGELDDDEAARVDRILDLHIIENPSVEELTELERLEAEQAAIEARRTGPAS